MGKGLSSFAPHEGGGGGGVAAALPTRTFIGNGARFAMADQVTPCYADRISSTLSCIGTASAVRIQQYRHDANRLTMTRRGGLVLSCSRSPLHSYVLIGIKPVHENDPNRNTPAKTNVRHKQTITRTHVLTGALAPGMFTIVCPY